MTGRRLLLSGAALTALLAIVAVASRAHKPGGGTSGGGATVPPVVRDYLALAAIAMLALGGAVMTYALAESKRQKALAGEQRSWARTLGGIAFFSLAILSALVISRQFHKTNGGRPFGAFGPTGSLQPSANGGPPGARGATPQQKEADWLGLVVLGGAVAGLTVAIASAAAYRRRHGDLIDEEAALAAALDAVLADTLEDLYAEREPRAAVIGAYARMEQTFAAYRVPREPSETPLEYLARVLDSLQVSSWSVRRLTLLFERAKFSTHEVDATMKDDAIAALSGLRSELESRDHEAVA
jgi:hypothetical protein